jgi:hypothetical protein
MDGSLKATMVGIFPSIIVNFGYLTLDEISIVGSLLIQPFFTVEYFDVVSKSVKSATYYASDFKTPIFNVERQLFKPFEVTLVPVSKRV